jgi:hypothetical protein
MPEDVKPKPVAWKHIPRFVLNADGQPTDEVDQHYQRLDRLIASKFPELAELRVGLLWKRGLKADKEGKLVLARVYKVGDRDKLLNKLDVIIEMNQEWWLNPSTTELNKDVVIFHELCHVKISLGEDGEPKKDENGCFIIYLAKHDLEEFNRVVEEYGIYTYNLQKMAASMQTATTRDSPPPVIQLDVSH